MKDVHILDSLEEVNLVSDPIRLEIIMNLGTRPKTAQDLADMMDVSRSKIHYHLKILEENGIIEVVDTELINSITQKYFLPVAKAFIPNTELFNKNIQEKIHSFQIDRQSYPDFKKDLEDLIEKYKAQESDGEKLQVHIYKLD